MSTRSNAPYLAAALLPLAALLGDLLAAIQGEAVWAVASLVALGLGMLALLSTAFGRQRAPATLAAALCLAASLAVRVGSTVPSDLAPAVATGLAALGVAILLFSGALVEGLERPRSTLWDSLQGLSDEPAEPVEERRAA